MESCQEMKSVIESILNANHLLDTFEEASSFRICLQSKEWDGHLYITKCSSSVIVLICESDTNDAWIEFHQSGQEWLPYSLETSSGSYSAVEFERSNGEIVQLPENRVVLLEVSQAWASYLQRFGTFSYKFYESKGA
jgi:hypothetical protein